jgi:hypothetical protein
VRIPHKLPLLFNIQTLAHLLRANRKLLALEVQTFEFPELQRKYFQFLIRHQECAFIQPAHPLLINPSSSISSHYRNPRSIQHYVALEV